VNINPRYVWVAFFVAINALATFSIFWQGLLLGESSNINIDNDVPILAFGILICALYFIILIPLFNIFWRIRALRFPRIYTCIRSSRDVGVVLLIAQILFLGFIVSEGVYVAGSTARSDSILSKLFVLFPVDTIFLIYYAYYRKTKYFYPNLFVAIISSVTRGWLGIFMTLIILESIRMARAKRLSIPTIFAMMSLVLLIFPFLQAVKLQIRLAGIGSSVDYSNILSDIILSLDFEFLISFFLGFGSIIMERLQLVSNFIVVYQFSEVLNLQYIRGEIMPFWMDGIHGLAYFIIAGDSAPANLGVQLATILDPYSTEVNWNSNPGVLAWLFISPNFSVFYFLYIFALLYFINCLSKAIWPTDLGVQDLVWFAWLVFLIPGWLGSLFLFAHSFFVFYLLHILRNLINRASARQ